MPNWKSGTPTTTEWTGHWRAIDTEGEVAHDEWLRTYDSIHKWLKSFHRVGSGDWDDVFLREVWYQEHRSHVIELVRPAVLTIEFLQRLQQWIREQHPTWRIIVPLFLGEDKVIVVYRDIIRGAPEFERDWSGALAHVRDRMAGLPQFAHLKEQADDTVA